ncbi:MAG: hypothetical protein ACKOOE_00930 [Micrococcales bacterium]
MKHHNERGTVTAELAIALPAVLLVLTIAFQALGLQVARIQLVSELTQLARQAARGEKVIGSQVEGNLICVRRPVAAIIRIEEKQCARMLGI